VIAVLFGALLPDLLDKPLSWYIGVLPTGRSLGHSLVFAVPLVLAVALYCRRHDRIDLAAGLAVGLFSHQLMDLLPILWTGSGSANMLLWPILAVEPYPGGPPTVLGLLTGQLTNPYFLFEFILVAGAVLVWRRNTTHTGDRAI
jgi:membrane-bound metal-dependent hydrolase YbcI (DUF457 family)